MNGEPLAAATPVPAGMRPLVDAMSSALARRGRGAPARREAAAGPRSILVLSGGGPWGAFGAGFLSGWSAQGTRPRFDLVTGVSTGALQATFAFLGPGEDAALIGAYRIADERELVRRRGTLRGALTGAFADTRPLEARVRAWLGPLVEQVAAPANEGRLLLVGVVDALDGEMYAVDLTRIARELPEPARTECYLGALMASAAVPVAFDRVEVGGRPYFDGGVRQSVFVTDVQAAAARAMVARGAPSAMYILINGDVRGQRIETLETGLLPTLARLRVLALNQIEMTSITGVAMRAPPGFSTYLATAEGQPCGASEAGRDAIFDPAFMACLTRHGRARGAAAEPWRRYAAGGG